jgi:hypothetical protein
MSIFEEICLCVLPSALIWHLFAFFVFSDSRFQKYRLRKALEKILNHLATAEESGVRFPELSIIYKNRRFSIGIVYKEINSQYSTYEIFINGADAGVYHRLKHNCCSTYYLEPLNKRHATEVRSIVMAGDRVLKKMSRPKKEKKNGYTEYSYFS